MQQIYGFVLMRKGNREVPRGKEIQKHSSGFVEVAKLTASNGEGCSVTCSCADVMGGDYFGWSVAIKGGTVAASSPWASQPPAPDGGTSSAPSSTGAAYVFTKSGSTWTQTAELSDPAEVASGVQDWFGWHMAVLSGSSVVATAPYDPEGSSGNGTGAAFVFTRTGGDMGNLPDRADRVGRRPRQLPRLRRVRHHRAQLRRGGGSRHERRESLLLQELTTTRSVDPTA